MQPNKPATPWGSLAKLVTGAIVICALVAGASLMTIVPGTGWSSGSGLEDHLCVTTNNDLSSDESLFGSYNNDGIATAPTGHMMCKSYDDFSYATGARLLSGVEGLPIVLAVLGLLIGFRRIISKTWAAGPFHGDTVRLLDRFRWWVAGALGAALLIDWTIRGLKLRLLSDEPWSGAGFLFTVPLAWVIVTLISGVCAFGARQREEAFRRGLDDRAVDDGRV